MRRLGDAEREVVAKLLDEVHVDGHGHEVRDAALEDLEVAVDLGPEEVARVAAARPRGRRALGGRRRRPVPAPEGRRRRLGAEGRVPGRRRLVVVVEGVQGEGLALRAEEHVERGDGRRVLRVREVARDVVDGGAERREARAEGRGRRRPREAQHAGPHARRARLRGRRQVADDVSHQTREGRVGREAVEGLAAVAALDGLGDAVRRRVVVAGPEALKGGVEAPVLVQKLRGEAPTAAVRVAAQRRLAHGRREVRRQRHEEGLAPGRAPRRRRRAERGERRARLGRFRVDARAEARRVGGDVGAEHVAEVGDEPRHAEAGRPRVAERGEPVVEEVLFAVERVGDGRARVERALAPVQDHVPAVGRQLDDVAVEDGRERALRARVHEVGLREHAHGPRPVRVRVAREPERLRRREVGVAGDDDEDHRARRRRVALRQSFRHRGHVAALALDGDAREPRQVH